MKVNELKHIEVLPGANGGAYSSSRWLYHNIKVTEAKTIAAHKPLNEGIDFTIDAEDSGGVIILSTDVNAIELDENKVINWVKQKCETVKNRLFGTKKIDKIAQNNDLLGWTVGHYLDGRYTAKNGVPFGENSLSVMIVGIDTATLIKIAEEMCRDFTQESVLVKDFSSGKIYFINGN